MKTQKYYTIQNDTCKDEGMLTLVPTDKELGVHVPVNHLNYGAKDSIFRDNYYH